MPETKYRVKASQGRVNTKKGNAAGFKGSRPRCFPKHAIGIRKFGLGRNDAMRGRDGFLDAILGRKVRSRLDRWGTMIALGRARSQTFIKGSITQLGVRRTV